MGNTSTSYGKCSYIVKIWFSTTYGKYPILNYMHHKALYHKRYRHRD